MEEPADHLEACRNPIRHSLWSKILCRGDLKKSSRSSLKPERQTRGAGAARVQPAPYPQSPFSGPARCCDVTDLYQAFSQRTGPGRLWISLDAGVLFVWIAAGPKKAASPNPGRMQKPQQFSASY